MTTSVDQYNIAAIRSLLKNAFTAQDLWRFCQERPDFQPVLVHFPYNATLAQMTDALIQYCQTQLLFDELLLEVQKANPRQYERYQAQLYSNGAMSLPTSQVLNNLPRRSEFVGREAKKARIHEALHSRDSISIDGIGGIGKTALALEVAHECLYASQSDDPPEGIMTFESIIWTTAQNNELTLDALLNTIAFTLDYPGIAQRPLDQKRINIEKLLREKPCLLIVDNFETITDEGIWFFLRYLPEPSKALITTREQTLNHVWVISLKGLEESEALNLIRSEGQQRGLASIEKVDDKVLLHLHEATGGAPLALEWAVGQIQQQGQSLDAVLTALHKARGSVFERIFSRSWSLLSSDAQQVLTAMPIFATSTSRKGIETASDVHHSVLNEALGQLVEMSLINASDDLDFEWRYTIHPLTRAFIQAKLQQEPMVEQAARQRLAECMQAYTERHKDNWLREGFAHMDPELPNILAIIQWCLEHQLVTVGMQILHNARFLVINRGYWNDALALSYSAIDKASKPEEVILAARHQLRPISWILRQRGDLDTAEDRVQQAIVSIEQFGTDEDLIWAKHHLGSIARERGRFEQAQNIFEESLEFHQERQNEFRATNALRNLAELALDRNDLDAAWRLAKHTLPSARRLGFPVPIANLLRIQGTVAYHRGDLEQARAFWEKALVHMAKIDRLDGTAKCLLSLAQAEIDMGNTEPARQRLLEAKRTYRRLDIQAKVQEIDSLLTGLPKLIEQEA